MGVSITDGSTALMRMPRGARSTEAARTSPPMAAFDTVYENLLARARVCQMELSTTSRAPSVIAPRCSRPSSDATTNVTLASMVSR